MAVTSNQNKKYNSLMFNGFIKKTLVDGIVF